ncbi:MAG: prolyl oligopeptidase family serine peptidase [Leptospirales bacterium]|nr:prolyl oligopeptidase family serine peptidase [Leptospirales bacterium]
MKVRSIAISCAAFWLLPLLVVCSGPGQAAPGMDAELTALRGENELLLPAAPGSNGTVALTLFCPRAGALRGAVLLLPGWKFSRHRWLEETALYNEASQRGLCLAAPEMNTTLYESAYYPETRLRWSTMPGQQWVLQILIPELQKRGLFREGQSNFLLGLSTGARGVALLALARSTLWSAAAALSGDFDQRRMPRDRLMNGVYGPLHQFPERWAGPDNPQIRAAEWKTPLYIAHGRNDAVVPFEQSERFFSELRRLHPQLPIEFSSPAAGHDFGFWSSQLQPAFKFFDLVAPSTAD